jgi:hypothetical protein
MRSKRPCVTKTTQLKSAIDLQSDKLIKEFEQHWRASKIKNKRDAFEGWALQKIAGLQVLLIQTMIGAGQ